MSPTRHSAASDLRNAIDCLPEKTRRAMLDGVQANPIICGGYTDGNGGICPMLAAHRNGGRTDFIGFAMAWDKFTKTKKRRRVTHRELSELMVMLETSLGIVPADKDLAGAVAEHQSLSRDRRAREAADTGGWGFLRRRRTPVEAEALETDRELVEV